MGSELFSGWISREELSHHPKRERIWRYLEDHGVGRLELSYFAPNLDTAGKVWGVTVRIRSFSRGECIHTLWIKRPRWQKLRMGL